MASTEYSALPKSPNSQWDAPRLPLHNDYEIHPDNGYGTGYIGDNKGSNHVFKRNSLNIECDTAPIGISPYNTNEFSPSNFLTFNDNTNPQFKFPDDSGGLGNNEVAGGFIDPFSDIFF